MAKTKKKPPIVGVPVEAHYVEKSRPLMLMKEVPFALGELKVLDTYLARINARDPEATTVRFSKEEYEDLMGIERMRPERLEKYLKSMMSKTVMIPDTTAKKGFRVYTLFDEAVCEPDDNGQWWIDLSCTTKAKKLFFDIDSIGYIQYQLKNVLPLASKYSVLLYIYLRDNRFRAKWEISLDKLREDVFRCASKYYAKTYKDFKRDILDKAIIEVNRETDLTFEYTPIKSGRKVTGIEWRLIKDEFLPPEPEQLPGQMSVDDVDDDETLPFDVLPETFTPEQKTLLVTMAYKNVPYNPADILPRAHRVHDYLLHLMRLMKASKNPVKSPFNWLKAAIENDYK